MKLKFIFLVIASFNFNIASAEVIEKSGYRLDTSKLCDGFSKVNVSSIEGTCVGLVASKQDGLKMPRYAVEAPDGTIYITEMYGWAFGRGTVYALNFDKQTSQIKLVNLFPNNKLTTPNGIVMDPEGRLLV